MNEIDLITHADALACHYLSSLNARRVFPDEAACRGLEAFNEPLPVQGCDNAAILEMLDHYGSPATVASAGPNYFGFVIGASLPAAAAAERLVLAWDQCASSYINSPVAHTLEKLAGEWVKEILQLPKESALGFGTSATACGLSCLATAQRVLLQRAGWDIAKKGLRQAPAIKVVVSEKVHVTLLKALRILGFGSDDITYARCDSQGRILPQSLPKLDELTLLCLQAGEVNTGEFDPFSEIIPSANRAKSWVHIDGAFGLWARASERHTYLTNGIELADSWTTDGHKWLNTPYDSAMAICRHARDFAATLSGDAVYAQASEDAQKNLTLEFSRRARGIAVWAALKSLGKSGIAALIDKHIQLAQRLADGMREIGFEVINKPVLNQVLARCETDEKTQTFLANIQNSGVTWFGPTVWDNRAAFRLSISAWRTEDEHIEKLLETLKRYYPTTSGN